MEKEIVIIETVSSIILDLFTIEELIEKGIKEINFKWKFNSKNLNLIPILELYKKDKIYKSIEATKFSQLLQDLLRETQNIYNPNMLNVKSRENFLKYLESKEEVVDCDECDQKDDCFLRHFKD